MPTISGVPPEKAVRRGLLLLKTFPEVVPDTPFRESFLGRGLDELSHVENLPQRLPILLAAGLVAAAAIGIGDLVLRGSGWQHGSDRPNELPSLTVWARAFSASRSCCWDGWVGSIRGSFAWRLR